MDTQNSDDLVVVCFPCDGEYHGNVICRTYGLKFVRVMPMSRLDHSPNKKKYVHGGKFACYSLADMQTTDLERVRTEIEGVGIQ